MDETPIKAGRKSRGKMKTTYYWLLYGDRDEVVFPWFASRAGPNVPALLGDYSGTLLSDGYAAYASYVAQAGTSCTRSAGRIRAEGGAISLHFRRAGR